MEPVKGSRPILGVYSVETIIIKINKLKSKNFTFTPGSFITIVKYT